MEEKDKLLQELGSSDNAKAFHARQVLLDLVALVGAPEKSKPAENQERSFNKEALEMAKSKNRGEVAKHLASALVARNNNKEKSFRLNEQARAAVCRALAWIATDAEVPQLTEAMDDLENREMARWALDRVNGDAATKALAEAATNAQGNEFRIGAINSLGRRQGKEVVDALTKCASDENAHIRLAAAEALASQADPNVDGTLAQLASSGQGHHSMSGAINRARIKLAGNLASHGHKDAAVRVYKSVLASSPEAHQKKAIDMALKAIG